MINIFRHSAWFARKGIIQFAQALLNEIFKSFIFSMFPEIQLECQENACYAMVSSFKQKCINFCCFQTFSLNLKRPLTTLTSSTKFWRSGPPSRTLWSRTSRWRRTWPRWWRRSGETEESSLPFKGSIWQKCVFVKVLLIFSLGFRLTKLAKVMIHLWHMSFETRSEETEESSRPFKGSKFHSCVFVEV